MTAKIGILLVNLGTPKSYSTQDVYRYLIEFLTDERVIDLPWFSRQLLVRGLIVPKRVKNSAQCYKKIWMPEGSPLLVYGKRVKVLLQEALGDGYLVELAMRYQQPSIENGLFSLLRQDLEHLILFPLFPQYASATTGSIIQKTMECLKSELHIPKLSLINNFADHSAYIDAFCQIGRDYPLETYDHFLFSYHGLPERHLLKQDKHRHCLIKNECCHFRNEFNTSCYSAQCHLTTQKMIQGLKIPNHKVSFAFQSRLGKEPWIKPYTNETIIDLAKKNMKRVLVFCPSFVSDCLETTYEIGIEYAAEFKQAGGEQLDLVQSLNDHPHWIKALKKIILELV